MGTVTIDVLLFCEMKYILTVFNKKFRRLFYGNNRVFYDSSEHFGSNFFITFII